MNLPPAMSKAHRENQPPPTVKGLYLLMLLFLLLGVVGLVADVLTARNTGAATRADLRVTTELLEQVRMLEEQAAAANAQHRTFNQQDHECIIALALLLSDPNRNRLEPVKPPCRTATLPSPAPTGIVITPTPGG